MAMLLEVEQVRIGRRNKGGEKMAVMSHIFYNFGISKFA